VESLPGRRDRLRDQGVDFRRRTGVGCTIDVTLAGRLGSEVETVLYRVTREAMTNVEKHARAGHVWVTLVGERAAVRLEIRDDGVGFDPAAAASRAGRDHYGLLGMRERVELAGGTWSLRNGPGRSTTVRATFAHQVAHGLAAPHGRPGVTVGSPA